MLLTGLEENREAFMSFCIGILIVHIAGAEQQAGTEIMLTLQL